MVDETALNDEGVVATGNANVEGTVVSVVGVGELTVAVPDDGNDVVIFVVVAVVALIIVVAKVVDGAELTRICVIVVL